MLFRYIIRLFKSIFSGGQGGNNPGAPELSNLNAAANGTTGFSASVHTDDGTGTLFWVITGSITPPTSTQIKQGRDHTDTLAPLDGEQVVSSIGNQLFLSGGGLAAGSTYFVHAVQQDVDDLTSNIISSSAFTTAASDTDFSGTYFAAGIF